MRELLMSAFKRCRAGICVRQTNWYVHGPSNPVSGGRYCNNHPCAVHRNDAHGILTFRDTIWPNGLLGATPRPPGRYGRMSLIVDEATILSYSADVDAYARAVIAELRRLRAW